MFTLRLSALVLGLITSSTALSLRSTASFPDPEPCEGNCTWVHDPSVVRRRDGVWFRFSSTENVPIATAPKLLGPWTYKGPMLPNGTSIHLLDEQGVWAPDVFFMNNQFYAYYAVSYAGYQGSEIGVATSETADSGTWTDHGSVGFPKSADYNLIDPNFFRGCPKCKKVMTFGSAWDGIYQTSLSDDFLKWSGEAPHKLAYNSTHPAKPDPNPSIVEGGFLFSWAVGPTEYYYLFFSSGACCNAVTDLEAAGDEYKIMVCRSTSSAGPFTDANGKSCTDQNGGTLVLGSHGNFYQPGGQGVIFDPDVSRIALYYHYTDRSVGYQFKQSLFGVNYLDFSSGWPVVTK